MKYFGVNLKENGRRFDLNREEFAVIDVEPSLPFFDFLAEKNAYVDDAGSLYNEKWCEEYRELCLKNYDLNMEFFSKLDRKEFNDALETFLAEHKRFVEITDLKECTKVEGYYLMVLDDYKQVYIGKTKDIRTRILRHWSATKEFDRTLFPMYEYKSCFSVDFFRALDTTRIFIWKKKTTNGIERKLIKSFPAEFCTNRIGGDVTTMIEAVATMKKRSF